MRRAILCDGRSGQRAEELDVMDEGKRRRRSRGSGGDRLLRVCDDRVTDDARDFGCNRWSLFRFSARLAYGDDILGTAGL